MIYLHYEPRHHLRRPARVLQQALLRLHWWSCRPAAEAAAAAAAASEVNQSHRHAVMVSGYVDIMICRCHYMSMWWYCDMSIWWFVDMMIQNRDNDFWLNMKNQFHFVCSVYMYVLYVSQKWWSYHIIGPGDSIWQSAVDLFMRQFVIV